MENMAERTSWRNGLVRPNDALTQTTYDSPSILLKECGSQATFAFVSYVIGSVVLATGLAVFLYYKMEWLLYVEVGLGVPLALEFVRRVILFVYWRRFDLAVDRCIRDHGSPAVIRHWLRNNKEEADELLAGMLLSTVATFAIPYVSLTIMAAISLPLGLNVIQYKMEDVSAYLIIGGLVPGAWLLLTAYAMGRFMMSIDIPDRSQLPLFSEGQEAEQTA